MKKSPFDLDKFITELDQQTYEVLYPSPAIREKEPKIYKHRKCPRCGSIDWWELNRSKTGRIVSCSECPDEPT